LGLKTSYYLRTLGASRIEKSTVNLAKFGGTSKSETAVSSGSVPSSVIIEETVAVAMSSRGVMDAASVATTAILSPISVSQGSMEGSVETKVATLMEQISYQPVPEITQLSPAPAPQAAPQPISSGIPSFGGETLVKNRPKIEVLSEPCESCSA
jgi:hypothetical protein